MGRGQMSCEMKPKEREGRRRFDIERSRGAFWLCSLFFAFVAALGEAAKDASMLSKPPMGWNSWNSYGCHTSKLTETTIHQVAEVLVSTGLRDIGYRYVNLDDCWGAVHGARNKSAPLQGDPVRFPSGMKALGDYLHERGMLYGIYSDCGTRTCQGYAGSMGSEALDVKTFADWGVDYLKLDGCWASTKDMKALYTHWSELLRGVREERGGRGIVFSCSWPAYAIDPQKPEHFNFTYVSQICDLWRIYGDISGHWSSVMAIADWWAEHQDVLVPIAGPDSFNDPDMLEVGNGLTKEEGQTQMAIWSILAAPLILGHDPLTMTSDTLEVVSNPEVVAVDQDPAVDQGRRVQSYSHNGTRTYDVWVRRLAGGDVAVALVNVGSETLAVSQLRWSEIGLTPGDSYRARDLWRRIDIGHFNETIPSDSIPGIPPHGAFFIRLIPTEPPTSPQPPRPSPSTSACCWCDRDKHGGSAVTSGRVALRVPMSVRRVE
mmetsp:Transcript_38276/g.95877  ORF Transcript_38276/g.95877 Transcript_38276/m.95877 type:complete len:489 (-) Transcript_38276:162-1628(-)